MTRSLTGRDISAIFEKFPGQANFVLVGKLALNFWAEALGISSETPGGPDEPIVNADIEILGSKKSAVELGRVAGGTVKLAVTEGGSSSSTALVTVNVGDQEYCIHFLCGMQGFSDEELERVRPSAMPASLDQGRQRPILVMHPVHCLREQLETVYGYPLSRRKESGDEGHVAWVNLAIEACRRITLRHILEGDIHGAQRIVAKVHAISLLPAALRAWVQDSVCVDDGIVDSESFPKDFRKRRLHQLRRARKRKICSYRRTYGPRARPIEA